MEVFERPELAGESRYVQVVQQYLRDDSVSPVALRRCAELYPDGVDAVLAQVLRRKGFTWRKNGEDLMRRNKPADPRPDAAAAVLPLGPRLVGSLENKPPARSQKRPRLRAAR